VSFHLAQVNIAVARFVDSDPAFAGFIDNLDRINSLADGSPGFIWRYLSSDNDAEAKRVFASDMLLFNMSLWDTLEALREFVYRSDHVRFLRQRGDWFVPQAGPTMALWWQPAGTLPTVGMARQRLEDLRQRGPSQDAFTFRNAFQPPVTATATE
jgi:hypothetical protein